MKSRGIAVIAVASLLGITGYLVSTSAAPPVDAVTPRPVVQISRERVNITTRGYQFAQANFKAGFADATQVAEWSWRRANAARDLPDSAERSAILRQCMIELRMAVATSAERSRLGASNRDADFTIEDRALECELWLAKAAENH